MSIGKRDSISPRGREIKVDMGERWEWSKHITHMIYMYENVIMQLIYAFKKLSLNSILKSHVSPQTPTGGGRKAAAVCSCSPPPHPLTSKSQYVTRAQQCALVCLSRWLRSGPDVPFTFQPWKAEAMGFLCMRGWGWLHSSVISGH